MTSRMGRHGAFRLGSCLAIGLIIFSSICMSTQAQNPAGFLSIDCGGTPFTDAVTQLPWEGDGNYTRTGTSGTVSAQVDSSYSNHVALQTFTYFPEQRNKDCYDLPTTGNTSFNLRAMFLHGSSSELKLPIQFDVTVNSTRWATITHGIDDSAYTLSVPNILDGIFYSPGNLTHFCLVPRTGVAFVSSIELRPLDPDGIMYSINDINEGYLSLDSRWNCGPQNGSDLTLRFPDDPFDRLWHMQDPVPNQTPATGTFDNTTSSALNNVPPTVMEDAWQNDSPNSTFGFNFAIGEGNAYVAVYVKEIEANASAGDRVFNVNLNGDLKPVTAGSEPLVVTYSNFSLSNNNTMDFTALPDATLGPVVNAIEIYFERAFNSSATAPQDVDALASLQASFNLTDWQGDPCYPISWDWVTCTSYDIVPTRVTNLLLSNMGINASIPSAIANLDYLIQIDLSNNSLYGAIPDSLASLPNLTDLYLNNNDLSGEVPSDLVTKLGSHFDYSGNRLLDQNSTTPKKSNNVGVIVGSIVGALAGLGIILCLLIWYYRSKNKKPQHSSSDKCEMELPVAGQISYEEVKKATNNFTTKIGQGSFGSVYQGWFKNKEVAVKTNSIQSQQGKTEFVTEVDILTRVHHKNLVPLIGYCNEGQELILVYEYQGNGTLNEWLHGKSGGSLDWKRRLQIAADGAKGLEYLHKGCNPTIIHRDVKTNNILLDKNMVAKVADFGLSKSANGENPSGYSTGIKGTFGYLDPEYHALGRLTHKSDVYSYGVVLAELLTGRKPFQIENDGTTSILVEWMRKLIDLNEIATLADPNLEGKYDIESMWRMADIALSCIDLVGARRPDFTQIVIGINEAIQLADRDNTDVAREKDNGILNPTDTPPYPSSSLAPSDISSYSFNSRGSYYTLTHTT